MTQGYGPQDPTRRATASSAQAQPPYGGQPPPSGAPPHGLRPAPGRRPAVRPPTRPATTWADAGQLAQSGRRPT